MFPPPLPTRCLEKCRYYFAMRGNGFSSAFSADVRDEDGQSPPRREGRSDGEFFGTPLHARNAYRGAIWAIDRLTREYGVSISRGFRYVSPTDDERAEYNN